MADFDDLLYLEERFYNEGYALGLCDGEKAGRMEGRIFGLEKGFEKYMEMGRLHGRCLVWNARCPPLQVTPALGTPIKQVIRDTQQRNDLANNPRLEKHLRVLYALTEPASIAIENTEDAVTDYDDRYKRAVGKTKVIERALGEGPLDDDRAPLNGATNDPNIEDVNILKARR